MDQSDFEEIMKIQRMMAQQVAEEQQTDNKIKLMDVINDLTTGKKAIVQKEAVIIEALSEGLTENQILRLIEDLKKDNFLIEKGGYLKKIS